MKLCWDNLEKYDIYLTSRGNFRSKICGTLYEYDACKTCGDPFLDNKKLTAKFCCLSCQEFTKKRNEKIRISRIGKKHTEKTKRKIRQGNIGRKHTDETKKKLSRLRKGRFIGEKSPRFGKSHTEKTRKKISNALKNRFKGEKNSFYGKTHTEESKRKMRENRPNTLGERSPFYGKHHTKEAKEKISYANKRKIVSLQQRQKQSDFMKKNNPMFNSEAIKNHEKAVSSKEYKENMSVIIKKRWEDEEYRLKYELTLLTKGLKKSDEELEKMERYRRRVKAYTKRSLIKFFSIINSNNYPIGIGDGFYNVDHIYSISDGFKNNVLPKIIGSYVNLQIISSKDNIVKNHNSWISIDELMRRYDENEIGF